MSAPLPQGEDKARIVRGLFDTIAPRYDVVNRLMTFGMDIGWRRRTVRELQGAGYRAVGLDFAFGMLRQAKTDAPLVQADALRLPFRDASADGVTCGFALRNVVSLPQLFAELARVVRPGGAIALLDASRPDNRVLRAGHALYFEKVVPFIGGALSDRAAYGYLPRSMAYLPSTDEMVGMLRAVGFPSIRRLQLSGGVTQLFVGTRV